MSSFLLRQDGFTSYTCVANSFIENYMPKASGEFVKIYIYLLKCVSENTSELSLSRIADAFENTQKDVVRALKYWEKRGLLSLDFEGDKLQSLTVTDLSNETDIESAADNTQDDTSINVKPVPYKKRQYSDEEFETFKENEDFYQLVFIVQKYLKRTLTKADKCSLMFFYDGLKLPVDVIDYLIEYCVSKGKSNMRYIDKTAIAWSEQGISTADEAKAQCSICPDIASTVLKSFGISGRQPVKKEVSFVEKWTKSYGFDVELISFACERTIEKIHKPSFEYADSILKNWQENNVSSKEDIKALDATYAGKASYHKKNTGSDIKKNVKKSLTGFSHREYDYAGIEKILLSK